MTRFYHILTALCLAAVAMAAGCVHQSPDNRDCTGVLEVSFYTRTRCQAEASYPGEVTGLTVAVFDSGNILAASRTIPEADIDSAYSQVFDLPEGLYTAVAWTGLDNPVLDLYPLADGATTKSDLLIRLAREGAVAANTRELMVLQGESPAFYIHPGEDEAASAAVNLLEVTNRITVSVSGLPAGPERYTVRIEADNGSMNADGTIAPDEVLTFEPWSVDGDPGSVVADFTLLKLETGHTYTIVITDTAGSLELYRGSLLGALILKNPEVDLQCDHDFFIEFTAEDQCACGTYVIAKIWVNDWLVHSYSTEF